MLPSSRKHRQRPTSTSVAMMRIAMETLDAKAGRLTLKNPPIIEAVIVINVSELPESTLSAILQSASEMAAKGYGAPQPLTAHSMQIKIDAGVSSLSGSDVIYGYRFFSVDKLYAVQLNRTGIVFSRLGKYDKWESFIDQAKTAWSCYLSAVGNVELSSFGVRFINKIFLPVNSEVAEFVQIYPHLPEDVPQQIQDMYMRIALPISDPAGRLIHQQTFLPPERDGFTGLLLDNDFSFSALNLNYQSLWVEIDKVRDIKDNFFRRCVTQKMMETFNA